MFVLFNFYQTTKITKNTKTMWIHWCWLNAYKNKAPLFGVSSQRTFFSLKKLFMLSLRMALPLWLWTPWPVITITFLSAGKIGKINSVARCLASLTCNPCKSTRTTPVSSSSRAHLCFLASSYARKCHLRRCVTCGAPRPVLFTSHSVRFLFAFYILLLYYKNVHLPRLVYYQNVSIWFPY